MFGERVIRYYEDRAKVATILIHFIIALDCFPSKEFAETIEKLTVKTAAMKTQKKKVAMQLKLKLETGDDLHEVPHERHASFGKH